MMTSNKTYLTAICLALLSGPSAFAQQAPAKPPLKYSIGVESLGTADLPDGIKLQQKTSGGGLTGSIANSTMSVDMMVGTSSAKTAQGSSPLVLRLDFDGNGTGRNTYVFAQHTELTPQYTQFNLGAGLQLNRNLSVTEGLISGGVNTDELENISFLDATANINQLIQVGSKGYLEFSASHGRLFNASTDRQEKVYRGNGNVTTGEIQLHANLSKRLALHFESAISQYFYKLSSPDAEKLRLADRSVTGRAGLSYTFQGR